MFGAIELEKSTATGAPAMRVRHIDIGTEYSPYLGPRYKKQGEYSGEEFRNKILEPAFKNSDLIVVELDAIQGYSTSFFEEAFGGIVRDYGIDSAMRKIRFETTTRAYLVPMIHLWMQQAAST